MHSHHTGLVEFDLQSNAQTGSSDKPFGSFKSTLTCQNKGNCFAAPEQTAGQQGSKNAEAQVQPSHATTSTCQSRECAL